MLSECPFNVWSTFSSYVLRAVQLRVVLIKLINQTSISHLLVS